MNNKFTDVQLHIIQHELYMLQLEKQKLDAEMLRPNPYQFPMNFKAYDIEVEFDGD